jgi:hypothetical protein
MSAWIAATAVITASPLGDQTPHGGRETRYPFAGFESLVTKAAVSARQPNPEHDRQASDLVFQVTHWRTRFLRALIHERSS